jgi:hypothetical protein
MMFDSHSRYSTIETAEYITPDGRKISYKRRRFLPNGETHRLMVEVTVTEGDRLDLIAARTLRDPEHFWRICDASEVMNPFHLTKEVGRILRVPIPEI